MVAIEADGRVGPLAADRVTTQNRETEIGEEGDRGLQVAHGDSDILKLDSHGLRLASTRCRQQELRLPQKVNRRAARPE
ncbi:hypothetical protein GCM10022261_16990 [Brevibacterium daeguense]|uniref:Uncharacterized protein n=1 Tax=Brevibacterium daeguense TaxID=909936 RepID=A0ABP8EJP2_9MICO